MGSIIRHGDKWRAVVRKKGYPTKTKVWSKKAQASQWVKEIELAMEKQELASSNVEISKLIEKYLEEIEPLRPGRRQNQRNYKALAKVTRGLYLEHLSAPGLLKWVQTKRQGVSRGTLAIDVSMISSVLRTAEAFWGITVPWAEFAKGRTALRRLGMVGRSQERDRRPEAGDLDRIKAEIISSLPMGDLIDFAVASAMRSSEITRITRSDLDEKKRTVIVRDRKHPTEKIGNDQEVPLLNGAFDIAKRQVAVEGDDRIFPFNPRSVEAAFRKACKRAEVEDLHFHDLRHHGISLLFEQGYAIQEVALVSGHKDWNQLRRYTNLKAESLHAGPVSRATLENKKPAE